MCRSQGDVPTLRTFVGRERGRVTADRGFGADMMDSGCTTRAVGSLPWGVHVGRTQALRTERGFTLFEICVAIAMIAIGFLAVLATLSAGLTQAHVAKTNATASLAARSAATYFTITGQTGDVGGEILASTATDVGGFYPRRPAPTDKSVSSEKRLPFSGYALVLSDRLAPAPQNVPGLRELTVDVYENDADRSKDRNKVGTYTFLVFRDVFKED